MKLDPQTVMSIRLNSENIPTDEAEYIKRSFFGTIHSALFILLLYLCSWEIKRLKEYK